MSLTGFLSLSFSNGLMPEAHVSSAIMLTLHYLGAYDLILLFLSARSPAQYGHLSRSLYASSFPPNLPPQGP